jgi:hypothetical protein
MSQPLRLGDCSIALCQCLVGITKAEEGISQHRL